MPKRNASTNSITAHKRSAGNTLLDVGCGTGMHMAALRDRYACEGLDVDRAMLAIAAERLPEACRCTRRT